MDKTFTSTNAQLRKLRSRGMVISNGSKAKRIIEMENYYNLINGYKRLFLDTSYLGPDEAYLPGTRFEEVYALYLFDRELRNLFMRYILEIENNVKSVLAHDFSGKYGHDNYLKVSNFDTSVKRWEKKTTAQKIGDVSDLISNLQHETARHLSKNNPMISHYMLEYGYVPLWVLVNTLTLGTISIFYSYLSQKDQNDIGRHFMLKPEEMNSFLQVLTIYRNACAHDERLYNLKALRRSMKPNSITTMPIHQKMNIPVNAGNNPECGKNDLFAIVIIFKTMLSKTSFSKFYRTLKHQMDSLGSSLSTISLSNVEKEMGFPINWTDIVKI
jgi:abortive infection bacteriophage resistance protein